MIKEKRAFTVSGYGMLVVLLALQLLTGGMLVRSLAAMQFIAVPLWAVAFVVVAFCWHGLFMVAPNQGKILQLFGKYVGTEHATGLR